MSFESDLADLGDLSKRPLATQLITFSELDDIEVARVEETWPKIEVTRRLHLVQELIELAEDSVDLHFNAMYKIALRDEQAEVRAAALRGLYEYESRDLIPVLVDVLRNDPDSSVRREAAIALGRYALAAELGQLLSNEVETVRQALFESAENVDEDEHVRSRAIEALGAVSSEETENLIESIYEEDSLWLKVGAVDAMGRSCNPAWLPRIKREMENRAPEMRHAAVFAAGGIGEADTIEQLKHMAVTDPDKEVQLAAVHSLGEIGGPQAKVALNALLFESEDSLEEAVQEALSEITFNEDPLGSI